jgi:hypothetical protein
MTDYYLPMEAETRLRVDLVLEMLLSLRSASSSTFYSFLESCIVFKDLNHVDTLPVNVES